MMRVLFTISLVFTMLVSGGFGQDPTKPRTLTLIDNDGVESPLKDFRFVQGTRSHDFGGGPTTHLEFREEHSTTFANGIVTLVPLTSVESLRFAPETKSATAKIRLAEKSASMEGTTKYVGINHVVVEYRKELPGLGLALLKFRGGEAKSPGGELRFSAAEPVPAVPAGRKYTITAQDKEKSKHEVVDPRALYRIGKTEKLSEELVFRIEVKIALKEIRKMEALPAAKQASGGFNVVLSDGTTHKLAIAEALKLGEPPVDAKLLGLVGRVPAGYKLFPAHTIAMLE